MAEQINVSEEDVRQAAALEKALSSPTAAAIDICAFWRRVKPFWSWIIALVKKIPKVGPIIARVLEEVGKLLDEYCKEK